MCSFVKAAIVALALSMTCFTTMAQERSSTIPVLDMLGSMSRPINGVVDAPTAGTFTFTADIGPLEVDDEPVWDWPTVVPTLPLVMGKVDWEIWNNESSFLQNGAGNPFTVDLPFGTYEVWVYSTKHNASSRTEIVFAPNSIRNLHVTFPPGESKLVEVTLIAVMDSVDGPKVKTPVTWRFNDLGSDLELDGNPGEIELHAGHWSVTGYHTALELEKTAQLVVVEGQKMTHVMVFDVTQPDQR